MSFVNLSSRRRGRGMTLVEIMVVVVIISLVTGTVGVAVFNSLENAKRKTAETQIKTIGEALELYRLSLRSYPSTAEGLRALTAPKGGEQPFMPQLPKDPWDNDYAYLQPGQHNPQGYDLFSAGKDGMQNTDDDIGNWERAK